MAGRFNDSEELINSIRRSPIASIVTDAKAGDNPIIAANYAFEALTGYREDELIGRNCRVLAGPNTEAAKSAALRQAIATGTPTLVEIVNYRKDGTEFLNAVMIAPLLGDDGNPDYFVGSQMKIDHTPARSASISAAERLRQLTAQQRAVLRLMARGMRNRQIGEEMGLSEKTIKMHRSALVKRLGLTTSTEAMRLAIEAGL